MKTGVEVRTTLTEQADIQYDQLRNLDLSHSL